MSVRTLQPTALWNHFADLNAVPRPSKKEERVRAFMKDFGTSLGLEVFEDEVGNVIIRKPGSAGKENRPTVVMQSHLDMVHQKNAATEFDFLTQGIQMLVEGDWVKADGTTLGADNGIGVAAIMAVLSSPDLAHPPIEALFTIDEETGMTGALALKGGVLSGKILLNLDTEDDRELTIGCAGGIDITATGAYEPTTETGTTHGYRLMIKGLTGGHSGMDIHLGRGNANKLMNRLLLAATGEFDLQIHEIDGGGLRNAIPRESVVTLGLASSQAATFESWIKQQEVILKQEYNLTDSELQIELLAVDVPKNGLAKGFQGQLLRAIYACQNGIYRMSPDISDLVQTSNNLARVLVKDGRYEVLCLTRSSVDTEKMDLAAAIRSAFELIGAEVNYSGAYPGWTPKPEASIVRLMSSLYEEMYQEKPHVNACHAGLECGILGTNYPEMEMISFGPNIRGAHSPDEQVQVSSVEKFWAYLVATLDRI